MTEIRRLTEEDLDEVFALDQFAFQFELSEADLARRRERVEPGNMIGFFAEDQLAAKMTILPLHTRINGAAYSMGGIASVATWPEYRRQGMVAQLLAQALSDMRESGQSISFLHPFSFAFYRKFGWETYVEYKKYTIDSDCLPAVQSPEYEVKRNPALNILNEVYDHYAMTFNGMLIRDEEWWQKRVFSVNKVQSAVCCNSAKEPKGYLLYEVKNHEMTIHEFVFLDEQARQTLWAFIRNHDSMIRQVTLKAPSSDNLSFLLANPRIKQEVVPYFMARIVDVKTFLEHYRFSAAAANHSFQLQVKDAIALWNNNTFQLEIDEDGRAEAKALIEDERASESSAGTISCDIQTLAAMLLGYQRPKFLHSIGRLVGELDFIALMEQRIPHRTTYLADFF